MSAAAPARLSRQCARTGRPCGHPGRSQSKIGLMDLPVMPPVSPMLAKSVAAIPGGAMSYEPKWDGFRSIIFRDGNEVEIGSRNERPMTRYFPEVVAAVQASLPERSVIDGEIVVPDGDGRCLDFEALLQRIHPADSRVRLLAEQTPAAVGAFPVAARKKLFPELQPLVTTFDGPPWNWQAEAAASTRHPREAEGSRWNAGKDLSFVPLRPERVVEVRYDHMEGTRFRHTAQFVRWRPDRDPASCGFGQLDEPVSFNLADILAG